MKQNNQSERNEQNRQSNAANEVPALGVRARASLTLCPKLPVLRTLSKRRTRRQEGMTLVEIMIVVVIMALIATAASVAILPAFGKAKNEKAETDCKTIKQAAQSYVLSGESGCPSVVGLIDARELDEDVDPNDPWDTPYQIECNGDSIVVTSAGEDQQFGSDDDLSSRRR